ncbi:MlaD family protein [Aurantimonas marina]|uniref:MlaD family protein n=1 Tax=Aurantimonas marina TaxID=2780508 RepID=UPI0019D28B72|nr:MlaD family protein [Aurantimonas marina]
METKANYVRVGIFTLVVLALSFGFVYWSVFSSSGDSRVPLLVRIEGSVTGLQQGSQVLFNGLPVGSVKALRIDPNNPRVVIATTEVDPSLPVKESTEANIGFQGLTGFAFIELKGGVAEEPGLIQQAREQGTVPIIKANPSDVTDILATARDIAERTNNILGQFEGLVGDVGPAVESTADDIAKTAKNVEVFTASLAENSDDIDNFLQSLSDLSKTANTVAEGLPDAISQVRGILAAVDPTAVSTVVDNVAAMSDNLRAQSENIGSVVDSVRTAADSVGSVGEAISRNTDGIDRFLTNLGPISDTAAQVAKQLDTTLQSANTVIAAVDPKQIATTLDGITSAASNVSSLAETIGAQKEAIDTAITGAANAARNVDRITTTIAERSDDVDRFIANLGPISDTATRVAERLDTTLESASGVIAAIDPKQIATTLDGITSAATNVSSVAESIGTQKEAINSAISGTAKAAQNVNRITTTIAQRSDDIDRFIGSLGSISDDVRQASARLNEAVTSANDLVKSIDSTTVNQAIGDVRTITAALSGKTEEIQSIIDGVDETVRTLDTTLTGFTETRTQVDTLIASIDPGKVNRAVENVSAATDNVARAADSIAGVANSVGERKDDINGIITNVELTSQRLRTASERVDSLISSVDDTFKGADDGTSLGSDIATTLRAIRETAVSIRSQVAPISANLQRFSGQGLREFQTLVRDVTRSVNRIEGAVNDFSNNPSRLIYGGDEVKQFDGRKRR